jgi:transcription elongation factor GreB
VFFGATVTVCNASYCESTYSIVGVDKAYVTGGRTNRVSPLVRALLKLREGDLAMLRTPTGTNEHEVVGDIYCVLG